MKADWFIEVLIPMIKASLLVRTLAKELKEQFNKLIGLNFFIELASGSFGIKLE
jgi:hypothetical protein